MNQGKWGEAGLRQGCLVSWLQPSWVLPAVHLAKVPHLPEPPIPLLWDRRAPTCPACHTVCPQSLPAVPSGRHLCLNQVRGKVRSLIRWTTWARVPVPGIHNCGSLVSQRTTGASVSSPVMCVWQPLPHMAPGVWRGAQHRAKPVWEVAGRGWGRQCGSGWLWGGQVWARPPRALKFVRGICLCPEAVGSQAGSAGW